MGFRALVLLLTVLFMSGRVAFGEETVSGRIMEVRTSKQGIKGGTAETLVSILVEGIAFHVTKDTTIVFADARKASAADLKKGQRVGARVGSDYRDSLPPQVDTDVIVIRVRTR